MLLFQTLVPLFEIAIIAIMLNYIISFFWNTRSMDLMLGVIAFLVIFSFSSLLNLPILNRIMWGISNVAIVAILIIFQPELRMALSKLSLKGKRHKEVTEFDKFLDQLANSVYRLAEKKVGALIALEHKVSLEEYTQKGILINAQFSSELLESIFASSSPLHDGAVVVRDMKLIAATVILPLGEDNMQLLKSMGTRHRAALGASQVTDAVLIVVSEETGRVSISRDGIMTHGVKVDRFKGILRSIFNPPVHKEFKNQFKLKEWIKQ